MRVYVVGMVCLGLAACGGGGTASRVATPAPPPPPPVQPVPAPSENSIELRVTEEIHADTSEEDRTFSAEVMRDIHGADGNVIVPRGSPAQLKVINAGSRLVLALRSVTVDGRNYLVEGGGMLGTLMGASSPAPITQEVLTEGKEVRVPAESVLTFRPDAPIRLQTGPR